MIRFACTVAAVVAVIVVGVELQTSWLESHVLAAVARRSVFTLEAGPAPALRGYAGGPYDQRLGYTRLPAFLSHLQGYGFVVTAQARSSATARVLTGVGLFPIYHEKDQAGLRILDRQGRTLWSTPYPRQVYQTFSSIPPIVVNTLRFIENRDLLDRSRAYRNPAVEWDRLGRAVEDLSIRVVNRRHPLVGGSTLATQLEKMRHSPGGRTGSVVEKARQMASASLRVYLDGPNTISAQKEIIRDYLNSIPLSAVRSQGEVAGLADGLRVWYGADFGRVNRLLAAPDAPTHSGKLAAQGRAYRQVLSLLLALRQPSRDLQRNPGAMARQTDAYLRALTGAGVIIPRLRDAAARTRLRLAPPRLNPQDNFLTNKGSDALRTALLPLLGLSDTYVLDRLDLTVRTTLDMPVQSSISSFLDSLNTPQAVQQAGLDQYQLLNQGNPASVIYSVALYERGPHGNLLRVQTDNYNEPLNINQGTRLQLGSTAKLRTLVNYLQIIEQLHGHLAGMTPAQLHTVPILPGDTLTQWAIGYLSVAMDRGLEPMLRAALQRAYSGNPGEAFFTAGGRHTFENFQRSEDSQIFTVAQGFQQSINLVFIRLMRDIERYYMYRAPGASPTLLTDASDPARRRYLQRFADFEARTFLSRFYDKYRGQNPEQSLKTLANGLHLTPLRAAVIFRSVRPGAGLDEFSAFLRAHLPAFPLASVDPMDLYNEYGPDKFNLNDRGYLAHVHPLELWLLHYRESHPAATLGQVIAASAPQRQEVYSWLFKTRYRHAQDKRIETILEIDAFRQIHQAWQKLGYPFDSLVPSYATSIGVSGDTPEGLAELAGILVRNGMSYPMVRIQQLHFAQATPFETVIGRQLPAGQQVLSPVIAKLVREQMIGVVENGTGRRAHGGIRLPDGVLLVIGGKTGTGDNRFHEFGARGEPLGSHVVNRTAAFVFFAGDRFFGTILAFVPDRAAANYGFTSALAVQILKDLEPRLMPLLVSPPSSASCVFRAMPISVPR